MLGQSAGWARQVLGSALFTAKDKEGMPTAPTQEEKAALAAAAAQGAA